MNSAAFAPLAPLPPAQASSSAPNSSGVLPMRAAQSLLGPLGYPEQAPPSQQMPPPSSSLLPMHAGQSLQGPWESSGLGEEAPPSQGPYSRRNPSPPNPAPSASGVFPMRAAQSLAGPTAFTDARKPLSRASTADVRTPQTFCFTIPGHPSRDGEVRVTLEPRGILIHDLKVDPTLRGEGFGLELLRSALRFGAHAGKRMARLDADDAGSGKLLRWYEQAGFRISGIGRKGKPAMRADIGQALTAIRRAQRDARETRDAARPCFRVDE